MIKKSKGFTLIELVVFIVISGIMVVALLMAGRTAFLSAPTISNQVTANWLATQCMEWLLGNRLLNGYAVLSCPSTPTGTLCDSITGFTVTPSVTCTTLGSDSNFKTLTVVVSGDGSATLKALIANF